MPRFMSLTLCLPLALLTPSAQSNEPDLPALFHLEVNDAPAENGKRLNMEFSETAREGTHSTVLVTRRSGGSVSSSIFVLRGMCGLTRVRGKQYFSPEAMRDQPGGYLVTFPDTAPPNDKGFSLAQCKLIGY